MGKSIGILSLKGGVGKTSIVSSLGAAMSDFGKKVLLVDANFSAPNLGLHLNVIDPEITLHHVLEGTANPRDAIYALEKFDLMPSSIYGKRELNYLKLRDKLKNLKRSYDAIIIDGSPALNEETLAGMLASDEILIATTPDHPTISTTLKAVKLANNRGTKIDGLILNKVHNKSFELDIDDIEKTVELPVLAVIPFDIKVQEALSELKPYTHYNPNSEGSIEYKKLAAMLLGEKYKSRRIRDYFRKVVPKRQEINRTIFYNRVFK